MGSSLTECNIRCISVITVWVALRKAGWRGACRESGGKEIRQPISGQRGEGNERG